MGTDPAGRTRVSTSRLIAWSIGFLVVFVVAVSMVASSSNPDPTDVAPGEQSLVTSVVNAAVIVFREGLEAVLIFAAITASFLGSRQQYRRPVTLGVAAAFAATVATWFAMTAVVGSLPFSQEVLLAITGIAAVVILLLVMNWFFHKVYWTDHIRELNTRKRELVDASEASEQVRFWGFVALGFTAVYREGFEVVLFLQNLNLVAGTAAVMWGVLLGLAGTTVVGFITFFLHHRLPYKRMLVLTGVLLGMVLVVMVGGSARTLQSLGVVPATPLPFGLPDWWARWFEIVPTWESIGLQALAALFVVGSYYAAEWWATEKRRRRARTDTTLAAPTPVRPSVRPAAPPTTVCGLEATTMCGAPATVANAAADGRLPHVGPMQPSPGPTTMAPALRSGVWVPPSTRLDLPRLALARGPAFDQPAPVTTRVAATAPVRPAFELPSLELRSPQPAHRSAQSLRLLRDHRTGSTCHASPGTGKPRPAAATAARAPGTLASATPST